jgi:hypothetical protein
MDDAHAVGGIPKGSDTSAAYPAGLGQFQLLPSKSSTDLLDFLARDSTLDACHHSTLRRCKVNVPAYAGEGDFVSVGKVEKLLKLSWTAMQPVEVPDDDGIDEILG